MKKILVSLICCLTATLGWAQEKNAYTLFDAQGNRVDYTQMMDVLERQDVVFIGEIHNCPIAHWMEYEIVKDLYDRHGDRLMIGAEMFERDNQLILDEYLAGMITPATVQRRSQALAQLQDRLLSDRRIRQRAQDSLRRHERSTPLRQHGRQRRIRGAGRASDEAKRYVAPLPLNYVPNKSVDEYFGAMKMPGMKQSAAENLSKAQAVKDATMAWSIAERMQSKLVHMNGNFHSTDHSGIITYLNQYRPGLKIGTVEVIRQENTDKLDPEALGKADFFICVPKDMTSTF